MAQGVKTGVTVAPLSTERCRGAGSLTDQTSSLLEGPGMLGQRKEKVHRKTSALLGTWMLP